MEVCNFGGLHGSGAPIGEDSDDDLFYSDDDVSDSSYMDLDGTLDDPTPFLYALDVETLTLESSRRLDEVMRRNRPRYGSTQVPTAPNTAPLFAAWDADDRHFQSVFRNDPQGLVRRGPAGICSRVHELLPQK